VRIFTFILFVCLISKVVYSQAPTYDLPIKVGIFKQQFHRSYTTDQGLPDNNAKRIAITSLGRIIVATAEGIAELDGKTFRSQSNSDTNIFNQLKLNSTTLAQLNKIATTELEIRNVAEYQGE